MYLAILVSLVKYKHTELSQIAKINVKAQISILAFGSLHINPRFLKLRIADESLGVKNADLHVKIQMQIEICTFTLIFAIDEISAVLVHFCNRDFSCKYPADSFFVKDFMSNKKKLRHQMLLQIFYVNKS